MRNDSPLKAWAKDKNHRNLAKKLKKADKKDRLSKEFFAFGYGANPQEADEYAQTVFPPFTISKDEKREKIFRIRNKKQDKYGYVRMAHQALKNRKKENKKKIAQGLAPEKESESDISGESDFDDSDSEPSRAYSTSPAPSSYSSASNRTAASSRGTDDDDDEPIFSSPTSSVGGSSGFGGGDARRMTKRKLVSPTRILLFFFLSFCLSFFLSLSLSFFLFFFLFFFLSINPCFFV